MSVTLTFSCGHTQPWQDGASPVCGTCGARQVSRTVAPAPRFRGVCVGPTATQDDLGAVPMGLAPSGALGMEPDRG